MKKISSISPNLLCGILFTSGALVMIYELVGTRVVAPYLGSSTYIWTSIIGVVLASLSVGYWCGGKWADDKPALFKLAPVFGGAAILVAATAWISDIVQFFLSYIALPIELQAIITALFLFAPAATLLGVISPYITRLHLQSMDTAGKQIGKMSAFSTLGSIAGTFLAGFVLIPLLGTEHLLMFIGVLLAGLAIICAVAEKKISKMLPFLIVLFSITVVRQMLLSNSQRIDVDTAYSRIKISYLIENETGKKIVQLSSGMNEAQSAMYVDSDEYVFNYTKLMDVFTLVQPEPKKVLVLGGAGYTIPRHLLNWSSKPDVNVVEIDPGMTQLAKKYFGLEDDPRLAIHHEDARTFLSQSTESYDLIMVDVFSNFYGIPFHILTEESMKGFYNRLNSQGVIVTNVIGPPQGSQDELVASIMKTFKTQFQNVEMFVVNPEMPETKQNVIVLATNSTLNLNQVFASQYAENRLEISPTRGRVLTDNYSPMESMVRAQWN